MLSRTFDTSILILYVHQPIRRGGKCSHLKHERSILLIGETVKSEDFKMKSNYQFPGSTIYFFYLFIITNYITFIFSRGNFFQYSETGPDKADQKNTVRRSKDFLKRFIHKIS